MEYSFRTNIPGMELISVMEVRNFEGGRRSGQEYLYNIIEYHGYIVCQISVALLHTYSSTWIPSQTRICRPKSSSEGLYSPGAFSSLVRTSIVSTAHFNFISCGS